MATQERTIAYLMEQLASLPGLSARKMFGEYALQRDGKTLALICDDQLFVRPTAPGRALAPQAPEAPAYPGAKPSLLIEADLWENQDWLADLLLATEQALPAPKPKRPKKP